MVLVSDAVGLNIFPTKPAMVEVTFFILDATPSNILTANDPTDLAAPEVLVTISPKILDTETNWQYHL